MVNELNPVCIQKYNNSLLVLEISINLEYTHLRIEKVAECTCVNSNGLLLLNSILNLISIGRTL